MKKTSIPKLALIFFIAAISGYFVLLLFVPFLGFGWHLLHGDHVSYNGWRIFVPRDFYARNGSGGPALWKHSLGGPSFEAPYAHISFHANVGTTHQFNAIVDYPVFEENMTRNAAELGFHFEERTVVPAGSRSAYCAKFSREGREPRFLVRCAVDASDMLIFYEGDSRYFPEFTKALEQMSEDGSANRRKSGNA